MSDQVGNPQLFSIGKVKLIAAASLRTYTAGCDGTLSEPPGASICPTLPIGSVITPNSLVPCININKLHAISGRKWVALSKLIGNHEMRVLININRDYGFYGMNF